MSERLSIRRRSPGQGYARGVETRRQLVEAAARVFAAEGYEKASTRQIAAAAGVTPPALQYHFDSKAGLHKACGEHIADHIEARLADAYAVVDAAFARADIRAATDALCELLDALVQLQLDDAEPVFWRQFLDRAQGDQAGPGHAVLRTRIGVPFHSACLRLVAQGLGRPREDPETRLIALLLINQLGAFGPSRSISLRLLDWHDVTEPRRLLARQALQRTIRAVLNSSTGSGALGQGLDQRAAVDHEGLAGDVAGRR